MAPSTGMPTLPSSPARVGEVQRFRTRGQSSSSRTMAITMTPASSIHPSTGLSLISVYSAYNPKAEP